MWDYLGVEVPDDAHGVLQDVHWSSGIDRLLLDLPDRDGCLGADLGGGARATCPTSRTRSAAASSRRLREWLGEHVHALGRKFSPQETLRRATGSAIQAQPYLDYLRKKYA